MELNRLVILILKTLKKALPWTDFLADLKQKVELYLENGSLLLMKDEKQLFWQNSLPVSKKHAGIRINLTFRTI